MLERLSHGHALVLISRRAVHRRRRRDGRARAAVLPLVRARCDVNANDRDCSHCRCANAVRLRMGRSPIRRLAAGTGLPCVHGMTDREVELAFLDCLKRLQ
jgi:hypothetical protein